MHFSLSRLSGPRQVVEMPTNWEERYQTGETPWERGKAAPPLEEFLGKRPIKGRILVPGCGFGHDVRLLASQGAEAMGLDISPSAIEKADAFPKIGLEKYRLGDLFHPSPELLGAFDWVWEHTCFCAIDPNQREDYVRAISSVLKPEGQLLGVFYIDPEASGGPPFMTNPEELDEYFSKDFRLIAQWMAKTSYPGRENCEIMRWMRRKN